MLKFLKIILLLSISVSIYANEYAVVVNTKNEINRLSTQQIKNIFLKKRHYIGKQKVIPVNISANMPLRIYFEKNILKMNREKLNGFWTKQHFHGITPPSTQSSTSSVKMFVQNVEGAVGYLPRNLVDKTLKVIYEF